jgi:DNA-binding transcriptional LysR family regulator
LSPDSGTVIIATPRTPDKTSRLITVIREPDEFDLNLLRAFVMLWREGHMGRAAKALGMSQPALSAALKRLREQLGDPLFVKTPHGMQPTAYTEQIAPEAAAILDEVRHRVLAPPRFDPAQSGRTFTLSTTDIGEMVFMPKLLRHLAAVAPEVAVRTVTGTLPERLAALARGDIDLLLGYYPDMQGADWLQRRLFDHGFVCLLREGHPAVQDGMLDAQAFLAASHALLRDAGRSQELVEHYLESQGLRRRVVYVGSHFLSLPLVVAATDLIATVPAEPGRIFAGHPGLQQVSPPFPFPHFDIKMYWHRRSHTEAASRWLRDTMVALFAGPAGWHLEA